MHSTYAPGDLGEVWARRAASIADDLAHVTVCRLASPLSRIIKTLAFVREVREGRCVLIPRLFPISLRETFCSNRLPYGRNVLRRDVLLFFEKMRLGAEVIVQSPHVPVCRH